jgi:hypothetical protein
MLERVRACFKVIRHVRPKQMVRDGADTCTILSQASQLRLRRLERQRRRAAAIYRQLSFDSGISGFQENPERRTRR